MKQYEISKNNCRNSSRLKEVSNSQNFIKAASSANVDAVKFQLVYADEICTKEYKYYKLLNL